MCERWIVCVCLADDDAGDIPVFHCILLIQHFWVVTHRRPTTQATNVIICTSLRICCRSDYTPSNAYLSDSPIYAMLLPRMHALRMHHHYYNYSARVFSVKRCLQNAATGG